MIHSRLSKELSDQLKQLLQARKFKPGELLPGQRVLAKEHQLSEKTVRRALKMLALEGLLAPEDRRGYRVLGGTNDPKQGFPFACVISKPLQETVSWFVRRLTNELQAAAGPQAMIRHGRALVCGIQLHPKFPILVQAIAPAISFQTA